MKNYCEALLTKNYEADFYVTKNSNPITESIRAITDNEAISRARKVAESRAYVINGISRKVQRCIVYKIEREEIDDSEVKKSR